MDLRFGNGNDVASPQMLEAFLDTAQRSLLIFTGIALPRWDSRGLLDLTQARVHLGRFVQRAPSDGEWSAVVGLASIHNTDSDFTFGTDEVRLETEEGELVLVVDVAVQGDVSVLTSFGFQLTVLVQERQARLVSILVSDFPGIAPPLLDPNAPNRTPGPGQTFTFDSVAHIRPAEQWRYRITLDQPAQAPGVSVQLSSDQPDIAGVPVAVSISAGQVSADFIGLAGRRFTDPSEMRVKISARLGTDSSVATLIVSELEVPK
jgi:hypothetical protein